MEKDETERGERRRKEGKGEKERGEMAKVRRKDKYKIDDKLLCGPYHEPTFWIQNGILIHPSHVFDHMATFALIEPLRCLVRSAFTLIFSRPGNLIGMGETSTSFTLMPLPPAGEKTM
jgi:hypothetical protein